MQAAKSLIRYWSRVLWRAFLDTCTYLGYKFKFIPIAVVTTLIIIGLMSFLPSDNPIQKRLESFFEFRAFYLYIGAILFALFFVFFLLLSPWKLEQEGAKTFESKIDDVKKSLADLRRRA
jgi:hypothetical protein